MLTVNMQKASFIEDKYSWIGFIGSFNENYEVIVHNNSKDNKIFACLCDCDLWVISGAY